MSKPTKKTVTSVDPKSRAKAIDTAIAAIERQFGKGSILRMNEDAIQTIPVIPTGSLTLDRALRLVASLEVVSLRFMVHDLLVKPQ